MADALASLETGIPAPTPSTLTQQHELIRGANEYSDLFAHGATVAAISLATDPHTTESNLS